MSGISMSEMSTQMNILLKKTQDYMIQEGYCFPSIYLFNKGTPIPLKDYTHPSIVVTQVEQSSEDGIYKAVLAFKMTDDKDEKALQEVANDIAKRYRPDAIGLILQCLYREVKKEEVDLIKTLQCDPEAIRVLHMCYYVNGDETGVLKIIPFVNKGSDHKDEGPYHILFMEYPWAISGGKVDAKLACPYTVTQEN